MASFRSRTTTSTLTRSALTANVVGKDLSFSAGSATAAPERRTAKESARAARLMVGLRAGCRRPYHRRNEAGCADVYSLLLSVESTRVVRAALIGNLLVTGTKFVAAAVTASSAMTSEAVHSLVDTGNELLLFYGLRRAAEPPDADHPFGHGRELYFWSFIVALTVFALGSCASVYQGVQHVRSPVPITNPVVN